MNNNTRMTELRPEVLKKLQETQIEILDEIVRICEQHKLHYFLMFGTLIGAVRHKGFIPWDDDLDIAMPRDDYNKFMEVAKKELDSKYYLQNSDTEPKYWLSFAKVRKNYTLFDEASLKRMPEGIHKGIFVDIFPLDYIKKDSGIFLHLQFILSKAINETMYYKAGVYSSRKSLRYRAIDTVLSVLPIRFLCRLQAKVASCQHANKKEFLADFTSPRNYKKAIYPVNHLLPGMNADFAGKNYKIPSNYDACLKMHYGDYMTLPKEEDRVNHCTAQIIFDTTQEK